MAKLTIPSASSQYREMVFQTSVIVRLGTQNRMVTKGYQKGVYDRVTGGIGAEQPNPAYAELFRHSSGNVYPIESTRLLTTVISPKAGFHLGCPWHLAYHSWRNELRQR